jgi:hypothetical protein
MIHAFFCAQQMARIAQILIACEVSIVSQVARRNTLEGEITRGFTFRLQSFRPFSNYKLKNKVVLMRYIQGSIPFSTLQNPAHEKHHPFFDHLSLWHYRFFANKLFTRNPGKN